MKSCQETEEILEFIRKGSRRSLDLASAEEQLKRKRFISRIHGPSLRKFTIGWNRVYIYRGCCSMKSETVYVGGFFTPGRKININSTMFEKKRVRGETEDKWDKE